MRFLIEILEPKITTFTLSLWKDIKNSYFNGGILRFSAGLIPLSSALRECIMKCLVGDKEETL